VSRSIAIATAAVTTFLLLEVGLFLLARIGAVPIRKPNYSLTEQPFWSNSNPDFGVWHGANARLRHQKSCFDVTYLSNSYGARDIERARTTDERRVVVLGDSFIEGFGLDRDERTTSLLESRTGIGHLNFGTSGHFGPTQYYLVYKSLAKAFSHDAVLIALLPDNDFLDDDFAYGRIAHANQYRPYWMGEYPDYELAYYRNSLAPDHPLVAGIKNLLSEFTYTYNALTFSKQLLSANRARKQIATGANDGKISAAEKPVTESGVVYSGYYDYSESQLQRLLHNLRLIRREAGGRPLMLFTIPRLTDMHRYQSAGEAPLTRELASFAERENMQYTDLLPDMANAASDRRTYFHTCDDHWSATGARVAADFLLRRFPFYVNAVR